MNDALAIVTPRQRLLSLLLGVNTTSIEFGYMDEIRDRAVQLIRIAGPKKLSQAGETNHERWKNISKGAIRMSTEEMGVLVKLFPEYALWLVSGRTEPENGHRSPEYDLVNLSFSGQSVG